MDNEELLFTEDTIIHNEISFSDFERHQDNAKKDNKPMPFKLYTQPKTPLARKINNTTTAHINKKSINILMEKSLKGQNYVPIHLRTTNDLRKKISNINKLKDEIQQKEQEQLKECTFRPSIILTARTQNRKSNVVQGLFKWEQHKQKKIQEERIKKEKQETQLGKHIEHRKHHDKENRTEFSEILSARQSTQNITIEPIESVTPVPTKKDRILSKPANKSYNPILDMISL